MISYYHNPKTEDLLIWDPESEEIFIIEKIKNIRVFTKGEITMGDGGDRAGGGPKRKIVSSRTKSGRVRITPELIAKIKQMKSELKSIKEIAEELGISPMSVWKYSKK